MNFQIYCLTTCKIRNNSRTSVNKEKLVIRMIIRPTNKLMITLIIVIVIVYYSQKNYIGESGYNGVVGQNENVNFY